MNKFEFANHEWLWLLLFLPLILLLYGLLLRWRGRKLRRFGDEATLKTLMPDASVARGWIKVLIFTIALGFLLLAAARPRMGSKLSSVESEGREIVFVVDVSNSMLAEDVKPSRMERTRYALSRLLENIKEDRVGIVAFADEAEVVLPITADYKMAQAKVKTLSPELIAYQGTDVGSALEVAMLSFSRSTEDARSRVAILITDGEAHDENALQRAERAAAEGIMICSIGIGTPEGEPLIINGEPMEDEAGKMVVTKLNEALLQQIAETTGGIYVRSRNDNFGLEGIVERLDGMEASRFEVRTFEEYDEQYQWFLGVAILLLVVEMLVLQRRNPLLRGVHLFQRDEDTDNTTIKH